MKEANEREYKIASSNDGRVSNVGAEFGVVLTRILQLWLGRRSCGSACHHVILSRHHRFSVLLPLPGTQNSFRGIVVSGV